MEISQGNYDAAALLYEKREAIRERMRAGNFTLAQKITMKREAKEIEAMRRALLHLD